MARLEQDRHRGVRDDDEAVGELHRGSEERASALGPAADDDLGDAEDEDRLEDVRHRQ